MVLTCTRAFYDYYQGENVSTKQLVQYYQSKEWMLRANIVYFDENCDMFLLKFKHYEHDNSKYTSTSFNECGVSVLDPVIFIKDWMCMIRKVRSIFIYLFNFHT